MPDGKTKILTCMPYCSGQLVKSNAIPLHGLAEVADCFDTPDETALKSSFLRKLATYLHTDPTHAKRMLERWQELNQAQINKVKLVDKLKQYFNIDIEDFTTGDKSIPLADIILWKSMEIVQ